MININQFGIWFVLTISIGCVSLASWILVKIIMERITK